MDTAVEMVKLVVLVTLVMVTTAAIAQGRLQGSMDGLGAAPDRYCLACLCQAATGCDLQTGCSGQGSDALCGPFYMSQPFWQDANTTAMERFREYNFPRCATDVECAAVTVKSYMMTFSRDCNGDGRVTCQDYGLMHFLGYTACQSPSERRRASHSAFHAAFVQCLSNMDSLLSAGAMQNYIPGCHVGSA